MPTTFKRVFITGGAGFIGSRLAASLATGAEVTVFDNLHPQAHDGNPANRAITEACGAKLVVGDVRDPSSLQVAIAAANPQLVYHLAAETGTGQSFDCVARYTDVNVQGTSHLIEAIRKSAPDCRRVVLSGSRSVYGEGACVNAEGQLTPAVERKDDDLQKGDYRPKDRQGAALTPVPTNADCVPAPTSIYASTKLMQEYLLTQAFWGTHVGVGILRLQNVYGPGQSLNNPYTGVLSIFCRQILEGRLLNIYEDGDIVRDFVSVDDVVQAFSRMGSIANTPQGVIDIGSGEAASIKAVAEKLLVLLGQPREKYAVTGAYRPGDIRHAVADIRRAQEVLGWQPQVTLDQGLAMLARWAEKNL